MWNTNIQVGDLEVVDSGFVTAFSDDIIEITIQNGLPQSGIMVDNLVFIFEFRDVGQEPNIETVDIDNNTLKLILHNHRDSGPRIGGMSPQLGTVEPLEVGSLNYRELFLNYSVSSRKQEETQKLTTDFRYTFYVGEQINQSPDLEGRE